MTVPVPASTRWVKMPATSLYNVKGSAFWFYAFVVDRSGEKGFCYWSIDRISEEYGYSINSLRRWKSEAIKLGLITAERQHMKPDILRPAAYPIVAYPEMGTPEVSSPAYPEVGTPAYPKMGAKTVKEKQLKRNSEKVVVESPTASKTETPRSPRTRTPITDETNLGDVPRGVIGHHLAESTGQTHMLSWPSADWDAMDKTRTLWWNLLEKKTWGQFKSAVSQVEVRDAKKGDKGPVWILRDLSKIMDSATGSSREELLAGYQRTADQLDMTLMEYLTERSMWDLIEIAKARGEQG